MQIAPTLPTPIATRPRVLMLTHRVPYPPDKGDRIRTYNIINQLAKHADVWLICLSDETVTHSTQIALDELCEHVAIVPISGTQRLLRAGMSALRGKSLSEGAFYDPKVTSIISDWLKRASFDSVLISSSSLATYLHHDGLQSVPKIVDLIDVDSQKWWDYVATSPPPWRWVYQYEATRVRRLERDIVNWAQTTVVVSQAEAQLLDQFTQDGTATVAGNGVDLDYFHPQEMDETRTIAFVGAMDYLPNIDAVRWFAKTVWPEIRRQHPGTGFRIIGRNPVSVVQKLAHQPGIIVTGGVPDVRPLLASSAVVVAPIRIARGVQNKVLEAMAMGKATVASPATLAALAAVPGRDLLRAESPEQWVTAVCHLLETPERRCELGTAGRQYVEQHHCWQNCLEPLLSAVLPQYSATQS